ncbi:MAG: CvpA family protein [Bacillota bacterium]|nr:CvpA family protein [Bacillota bacterium]
MANLNGLDYVLLFIVGFSSLRGFARGLVRQVFDLLAWILSIYFAFSLGPSVGSELTRLFKLDTYLNTALGPIWGNFNAGATATNILGFIIVLLVVRALVEFVASVADFVARLPIVSTFNRLGGAILGFVKGIAVVFVVAALIKAMPVGQFTEHIERSQVVTTVLKLSPALYEYLKELIAKATALV